MSAKKSYTLPAPDSDVPDPLPYASSNDNYFQNITCELTIASLLILQQFLGRSPTTTIILF